MAGISWVSVAVRRVDRATCSLNPTKLFPAFVPDVAAALLLQSKQKRQ